MIGGAVYTTKYADKEVLGDFINMKIDISNGGGLYVFPEYEENCSLTIVYSGVD